MLTSRPSVRQNRPSCPKRVSTFVQRRLPRSIAPCTRKREYAAISSLFTRRCDLPRAISCTIGNVEVLKSYPVRLTASATGVPDALTRPCNLRGSLCEGTEFGGGILWAQDDEAIHSLPSTKELATRNPRSSDTTLIPPRAQYGATRGKAEKGKWLRSAGLANSCKPRKQASADCGS